MSNQTSTGSGEAHAVAGPFTLRETVLLGGALLLLVGSVLPFQVSSTVFANLWVFPGTLFHLGVTLILPLAVAGGFIWRRLVGRPVVRVGSLSLDQLGSISAILSVAYFFFALVGSLNGAYLLGLFGALAFLAATTLAPLIPAFPRDFEPAEGHLLTRPVRPAALRTAAAPAFPKPGPAGASASAGTVPAAAAASGRTPGSARPTGASDSPAPTLASTPAAASTPAGDSASALARMAKRSDRSEGTEDAGRAGQERPSDAFAATGVLPAAAPQRSEHSDRAAHAVNPEQERRAEALPETGVVPAAAAAPNADSGQPTEASGRADATAPAPVHTVEHSDRAGHAGQERAGQERPGNGLSREAATTVHAASAAPTATAAATATAENDDEPFAASLREEAPVTYQAFWFAVPQTRHALDEATGAVAFTLQPGAWILALEDRGHEFLVQDTDGRLGVLRDLAHVERA